jgi:hypothetical protein
MYLMMGGMILRRCVVGMEWHWLFRDYMGKKNRKHQDRSRDL